MSDDEERTAADDAVISKYMQASEIANGNFFLLSVLLNLCIHLVYFDTLFIWQVLLQKLLSVV